MWQSLSVVSSFNINKSSSKQLITGSLDFDLNGKCSILRVSKANVLNGGGNLLFFNSEFILIV